MVSRYPATCIARIANKICRLYAAILLTCICFAVAILVNVYIFFSKCEFKNDEFCEMMLDSHLTDISQFGDIAVMLTRFLSLFFMLITCVAFLALCCGTSRPADHSITDDGMKEGIVSEKSERRLIIAVLISAVLCFSFLGLLISAFLLDEIVSVVYMCLFPSLYFVLIDEYRQLLVGLCKRGRKKEGKEEKEETDNILEIKQA